MLGSVFRKGVSCVASAALAVMMLPAVGGGVANADENTTKWWQSYVPSAATTVDSSLITTYGVRAGSAGGDYLGLTNTNFDFTAGKAGSEYQYYGYTGLSADDDALAGLAIWASSANTDPNPYYANLFYNIVNHKYNATAYTINGATEYYVTNADGAATPYATTWMKNPPTSSWGDSLGYGKALDEDGEPCTLPTAAGREFKSGPDVVFGAAKTSGWTNHTDSGTNFYTYDQADANWNPTYSHNDATNVWTQIYTLGKLAETVESGKTTAASNLNGLKTRYGITSTDTDGDAATPALDYEKSIRGNLLYIASQIDAYNKAIVSKDYTPATAPGVKRKTVAYLYAIDGENNYAYIFTPNKDNLKNGTDTGDYSGNTESSPSYGEGSNNGTISFGYMDTLPFITDTYAGGTESNITMKVEDISKSNPARRVSQSEFQSALSDIDYVIYNTNTALTTTGISGGKNSTGIVNTGDFAGGINPSNLATWLNISDTSKLIAGDDFGTGTNADFTIPNQSPRLYCQRNYTMDKNARAAWAFSKVYPELYNNKSDSSYAYWVNKVYHIDSDYVNKVVAYMTNQTEANVNADTVANMESYFQTGYDWWFGASTGESDSTWAAYTYYSGSSRASYYSTSSNATPSGTVGIFRPSVAWIAAQPTEAALGYTAPLGTQVSAVKRFAAKAATSTASASSNLDTAPTKEAPQTHQGVQWYWDGEAGLIHIEKAAEPEEGYSAGECNKADASSPSTLMSKILKVFPAATKEDREKVNGYIVHEGVTFLGYDSMRLGVNTTTVSLPASLEGLGRMAIMTNWMTPGAHDAENPYNLAFTIAGVYDNYYIESKLESLGDNAFNPDSNLYSDYDTSGWLQTGVATINGESNTVLIPEDCAVSTTMKPYPTWKKVPLKKTSVDAPEVSTAFEFDGTEKSLGIESTDFYEVSGTTSATDEGVYIAKLSLKNTKAYEWSDGTSDDIYIGWTITSKVYDQADLDAAADAAAAEAIAKAEEDAAKAACEAAGVTYDETKSAADNMAAAKAAADTAAEQAKIAAINEAVAKATASQLNQTLTIDTSAKTVKAPKGKKKLTKKKTTSKIKVTGAKGKVTFVKIAKGSSKKLTVNKKNGKITVKKGAKKGTYKVKVKVNAAAKGNYKATTATVTISVIVK